MITVDEAKEMINGQVVPLHQQELPLVQAAGLVLASGIVAGLDIPAYDQSSMDGYAFSFEGWEKNQALHIDGEVPAGEEQEVTSQPGQATRIFTGAAVPDGADTVVMQEKVVITGGKLVVADDNIKRGANVRPKGSEIKAGEMALEAGSRLTPAAIGFLAGIGVTNVNVYPRPRVSIIVTGRELQQPGKPLLHGQVYESNSAALTAALQQLNIREVKVSIADDDLFILTTILKQVLMESDVVLLTGGVSVGDYDFVLEAATQCGVEKIFHRIRQRPGKPLYFGKKARQLVFGLPGNPSSVLTCFYEYVLPALQKLSNLQSGLTILQVPIAKLYEKAPGLTHFLKGYYDGSNVLPLNAQESYRLSSFARANCMIRIGEDQTCCAAGEIVEVHMLPE